MALCRSLLMETFCKFKLRVYCTIINSLLTLKQKSSIVKSINRSNSEYDLRPNESNGYQYQSSS